MVDWIHHCCKKDSLYFDLSQITGVTPDAIMYLIAVIHNSIRLNALGIRCKGNFPTDSHAESIFRAVGFGDYFHTNRKLAQPKDTDRITIKHGDKADSNVIAEVCDFVMKKSNTDSRMPTKHLYKMLIELMTNTKQHAYREKDKFMAENWYVYAENSANEIKLVFLDTGLGIPKTIRKDFWERIMDFPGNGEDGLYIAAALKGEFRTETKMEHRGKGLPEIYNAVTNLESNLSDLTIVSGRGMCMVDRNGRIGVNEIAGSFEGTLFSWNYRKEIQFDNN